MHCRFDLRSKNAPICGRKLAKTSIDAGKMRPSVAVCRGAVLYVGPAIRAVRLFANRVIVNVGMILAC